jgi:hypothetical protein
MRNILFSIFVLFLSGLLNINDGWAETNHQYQDNSVLSSGKWAKIKVKDSGIYKITYSELQAMGFSDPSNIRVFGYGGAMLLEDFRYEKNPKIDDLTELAIYDGGSYILFYAQGPVKWNYNSASENFKFEFNINPYTDYGCYFLTTDAGTGKRIELETPVEREEEDLLDVYDFIDYAYVKKEELNFVNSGRVWYGDEMNNGSAKNYNFNFPNIIQNKDFSLKVVAAASSSSSSSLRVSCDNEMKTMQFFGVSGYSKAYEESVVFKQKPTSENISLSLRYTASLSTDKAAVNYILVNAWCELIMTGSNLFFRNTECIGNYNYTRFNLQNTDPDVLIWDITDPQNIKEIPTLTSGKTMQFIKKTLNLLEFVAVKPSGSFKSVEFVGIIPNQNLHAFPASTDYVIISHPDFLSEAERLAENHRQYGQIEVVVCTPEQVYNEFSSGTPDATAYRWLMKMLYDRDNENKYKYLLLFGDGSFDNKGILATRSNPANNYILTFQSGTSIDKVKSFTTDDYFGFLQDAEGQAGRYGYATVDIGIGRFPVTNTTEAAAAVDKAIAYMKNKNKGAWKNKICLVADDNEEYKTSSSFTKFVNFSEKYATNIYRNNPAMEVKKLYFDAYSRVGGASGGRFPEVESLFQEEVNTGVLFLNYVGHSNTTGWSAERIFTQEQARSLRNRNLGFWFTASCEFTRFDGYSVSGGESLFLNPNGGAIAVYSASRVVYDGPNDKLNEKLFDILFERDEEGKPLRLGDIYRLSKQGSTLLGDSNKLSFIMLGDPALRLTYPDLIVKTAAIELVDGETTDTLRALSEVQISGIIEDEYESFISNFSGKVYIKIYDKEVTLSTKGQINDREGKPMKYTYRDRPNVLFSGEADVVNGKFSFVFRIPKDINYNYGSGRISYYAFDEINGFEAQGYDEDFIIGGSGNATIEDTEGPKVVLYMNSEKFRSGDKINESPLLYIFANDNNGINASGVGIGHDITLKLNDSKDPIILNSYFSYNSNSSTSGSIVYPFENLENGRYTLTFKIWDLLNNSTTKQIEFEVVRGLPVKIEKIQAYPNPAVEYVDFIVYHDRPETILDYKLSIYDLGGRKVHEIAEDNYLAESQQLILNWNLQSGGVKVQPGLYIYRLEMKTTEGDFIGKSQKLLIHGQ